jgi:hypothetical protein
MADGGESRNGDAAQKEALGGDLVLPALALAFSAYFFWSIADLSWEAKANGIMIGAILVVLVAIQIARVLLRVRAGTATLGLDRVLQPYHVLLRRIGMVALTAIFIAVMPVLGLTLALFLAMMAGMLLMGVRRPLPLVLVSAGTAAAAYLMFIAVLDSGFPHGPIEDLIASLG